MVNSILDILTDIDILFTTFANILSGKADIWDFLTLATVCFGTIILAYMWIKEEIIIRKKMKEIREAREAKKSSE